MEEGEAQESKFSFWIFFLHQVLKYVLSFMVQILSGLEEEP